MRTLSFRSIRRASALASRSAAGTLIWNSCFNPSTRVSVTCMVSIFFRVRPWPSGLKTVSMYGARDLVSLRRWFGEPAPTGQALQKFVMQTLDERLVRAEGLEPPQLSSLEPKSSASTSSATPADSIMSGRDAASGGLITWARRFAAKKWHFTALGLYLRQLDISSEK